LRTIEPLSPTSISSIVLLLAGSRRTGLWEQGSDEICPPILLLWGCAWGGLNHRIYKDVPETKTSLSNSDLDLRNFLTKEHTVRGGESIIHEPSIQKDFLKTKIQTAISILIDP
jgi:hypothetical protein